MDYNEWNTAIARHFFNAASGGKEVLLFFNEEKIIWMKLRRCAKSLCTFKLFFQVNRQIPKKS